MPQSSHRDDFSKQTPQTVLPIVHISEGICIVGLARRAIAQTLVLTLQRFLGQGLSRIHRSTSAMAMAKSMPLTLTPKTLSRSIWLLSMMMSFSLSCHRVAGDEWMSLFRRAPPL